MATTKIDTIKLGTSEYEIDLKSTATPSIASLTTSTLTVTGNSSLSSVSANSIETFSMVVDEGGLTGQPGCDLSLTSSSGDLILKALDGNIDINRTYASTSNVTTGAITISNGRGDITLSTYEGHINIYTSTSIPGSGANITLGPAILDPNTSNQIILLKGKVTMSGYYGSVTVSNGAINASGLTASYIYTSSIGYPTNSSNSKLGIKLTSTNITLSSGESTEASISVISPYGVSISSEAGTTSISASTISLSSTGSIYIGTNGTSSMQLFAGSNSINLSCTTGSIYLKTNGGKIVLSTSATSASNTLTISKHGTYGVSVSAGQGLYVTASKTNKDGGLILNLSVSANSPFYLKKSSPYEYTTGTWLVLGTNTSNLPYLVYNNGTSSSRVLYNICQVRATISNNDLFIYLRSATSTSEAVITSMYTGTASYYAYIKDAHLIRLT